MCSTTHVADKTDSVNDKVTTTHWYVKKRRQHITNYAKQYAYTMTGMLMQ